MGTLVIAISVSVGTGTNGAAAAARVLRFRFTGRRFGLTALLIIQMFPQMLAFVAIFLLLLSLGDVVPILGVNSTLALMEHLGGALGVNYLPALWVLQHDSKGWIGSED